MKRFLMAALVLAFALGMAGWAAAVDTVTLIQDGATNTGTLNNATPSSTGGNVFDIDQSASVANAATITWDGDLNSLDITQTGGANNTATIDLTVLGAGGSSNDAIVYQATAATFDNTVILNITGDSNIISGVDADFSYTDAFLLIPISNPGAYQLSAGDANSLTINQTGDSNEVYLYQDAATTNTVDITQDTYNILTVTQISSAASNSFTSTQAGATDLTVNTAAIYQKATLANIANLTQTGGGNYLYVQQETTAGTNTLTGTGGSATQSGGKSLSVTQTAVITGGTNTLNINQ